jgi:anti-anti-sigma factor
MSSLPPSKVSSALHKSTLVLSILESKMRDLATVNEIKDAMVIAVREASPNRVIIDLQHVEFIGSVGFLAFLALRREPGVENITLCGIMPNVREVFLLCKLIPDQTMQKAPFQVADSVELAMSM